MDAAGLGLADDDYFNGDATQDGGNMARLSASLSSAYVVVGVVVSNSSSSSSSSGGGGRSRRRRRRERGCCSSDQIAPTLGTRTGRAMVAHPSISRDKVSWRTVQTGVPVKKQTNSLLLVN